MSRLGGTKVSKDTDADGGVGGQVNTVVAGTNCTVDATDAVNPIVNVTDPTPLTTKGDLLTYDTADARLAVGTNAQVLTADSAEATGMKWADPAAAPTFSGALVTNTGAQTVNSTISALTWDTEAYDVGGWHDTGTNPERLTVPSGVAYVRICMNMVDTASITGQWNATLYKNGSATFNGACTNEIDTAGGDGVSITSPVIPVVATDYFEFFAFATTSRTTDADVRTSFSIEKVG